VSKILYVFFVGGGEVDEAGEVGGDGVEGGDVIEAELAESGLEDFDAWGGVNGRCGCGRDKFVWLGGRYW
jgi:hypothetical protein